MNKISLYILLILIFLGLSKSFSPKLKNIDFIKNKDMFQIVVKDAPISLILKDSIEQGTFIKSYYQKYQIIHGFKPNDQKTVTFRTTKDFWEKNKKNIGMSLYRTEKAGAPGDTTPMPPGFLFIGDSAYGSWEKNKNGENVWIFQRSYGHFPKLFEWKNFKITKKLFLKIQEHKKKGTFFYGDKNQFKSIQKIEKIIVKKKRLGEKIKEYITTYWSFPEKKRKK